MEEKSLEKRTLDKEKNKSISSLVVVALLFVNIFNVGIISSKIPNGYEMGIILIAFQYYFFAAIIFIVTAILIFKTKKNSGKFIIGILSTLVIAISGYFICIYETPIKSTKEQKSAYLNQVRIDYKTIESHVSTALKSGNFYYPGNAIKKRDSLAIESWFLKFMDRNYDSTTLNSGFIDSISYYFNHNDGGLTKYEFENFKKSNLKTFKIDHISYSPDYNYLICFVSFETYFKVNNPLSSTHIVYLGIKKANEIELFHVYRQDENWVYNQEFGFYKAFQNMENGANGLGSKSFWKDSEYFEKYDFKSKKMYYFQLCNKGNNVFTNVKNTKKSDLLLKKPIIINL